MRVHNPYGADAFGDAETVAVSNLRRPPIGMANDNFDLHPLRRRVPDWFPRTDHLGRALQP